ncbi:Inorganic pyrophosphatase [Porphyridium purpureum]|uniref:inorganic diphosphatase n=1 Tax=Porphyridium purpureum TaxID=35688 RepID=A0A5J4YYE5_PORPP|nr:Inorganic pyrophosphatase [Porphyridium purpureum]|eukprot:POR3955..scf208_2
MTSKRRASGLSEGQNSHDNSGVEKKKSRAVGLREMDGADGNGQMAPNGDGAALLPATAAASEYEMLPVGTGDNYKSFMMKKGFGPVNPLHDIPLWVDKEKGILNMIVEIPRWTNAKLELKTKEPLAPIVQDEKKGKKRYVHNVYPYKGYIWNYGCFPQTWEDPTQVHMETGALGDGDPLDVCEVGSEAGYVGQVKQVKVIGVLGMIDEGEMDWKVLVIDVKDPIAEKLNDKDDLYTLLPGLIHATFSWFRTYKVPDGKPLNMFAFREQVQTRDYAMEIVDECYHAWRKLINGKVQHKNHDVQNTTIDGSYKHIEVAQAQKIIDEESAKYGGPISALGAFKKGLQKTSSMLDMTEIDPPSFSEIAPTISMMTIKRFCTQQQRKFPHDSNDLSLLISEVGVACKCISAYISDHPHMSSAALTHFANSQLHASLSSSGLCCVIFSSESAEMPLEDGLDVGNYIVVFNPLMGTPGISMGNIFGVYYRKSAPGKPGDSSDLLQRTGYEQVAAGYCVFGPSAELVFSMGFGVHGFKLDRTSGHFVLSREHVRIPETGPVYSIDSSVLPNAPEGVNAFVAELEAEGSGRILRYEHNLVSDFHKVLINGGILMLPGPHKKDLAQFLSVAAPLAYIARHAGGRASVGKRPLLELSAWSLDMAVPLYVGSSMEVDRIEELTLGHVCHEKNRFDPDSLLAYNYPQTA